MNETPGAYFMLIAHEYKDKTKQELIAVRIRYVRRGTLRKRAIGFVADVDVTASQERFWK